MPIINKRPVDFRIRTCCRKPRCSVFWEETVLHTWNDDDYKANFRLSKASFAVLCNTLRLSLTKRANGFIQPISVEKKIAIALWYLQDNSSMRTIGHLFSQGKATVSCIVKDVCYAIMNVMFKDYVKMPSNDELLRQLKYVEDKWGWPQFGGAIDGTHIPVRVPTEYQADYYNRHKYRSINVQAVIDCRYLVRDLCVGWPGRAHDARVLSYSKLFEAGQRHQLFPNWTRNIEGVNVPVHIIGDAAYPTLDWLVKPHKGADLNPEQRRFNTELSKPRMYSENYFGRMKGRFAVLDEKIKVSYEFQPSLIAACFVLNNFVEIHENDNDDFIQCNPQEAYLQLNENVDVNTLNPNEIRQALTRYFTH